MNAQVSENTLESISTQTNVLKGAEISVGNYPINIGSTDENIYVINRDSNTVSVIDPNTNNLIKKDLNKFCFKIGFISQSEISKLSLICLEIQSSIVRLSFA